MNNKRPTILALMAALLLAACAAPAAPSATLPPTNTPIPPTKTLPPPQATPIPPPTVEMQPTVPPEPTQAPQIIDPMPQPLLFQSGDGELLEGIYFPSAAQPAPLVVLMHWAPGDQSDWNAVAFWLQNQGLLPEPGAQPWLDASWFPAVPEGRSYAVFTFTFRGCLGGCRSFEREKWLEDARAAMEFSATLPGVDAQRVVAIGASIGADGALDGCLWLNQQGLGRCLGAMSFSPGDYLTLPYDATARELLQMGFPAWCFYAEGDSPSAQACQAAEGEGYQSFTYPGGDHGMALFRPDADPSPLEKILEFLDLHLPPADS